jgi:hypothetical protein
MFTRTRNATARRSDQALVTAWIIAVRFDQQLRSCPSRQEVFRVEEPIPVGQPAGKDGLEEMSLYPKEQSSGSLA